MVKYCGTVIELHRIMWLSNHVMFQFWPLHQDGSIRSANQNCTCSAVCDWCWLEIHVFLCLLTANVRTSLIHWSNSHSIGSVNAATASGNDVTQLLSRYYQIVIRRKHFYYQVIGFPNSCYLSCNTLHATVTLSYPLYKPWMALNSLFMLMCH